MPYGIAAAGIASAIGSVVGSGEQASGQQQAANTQLQEQQNIINMEQPYLQSGYNATSALNNLLGLPTTTAGTNGQPGTSTPATSFGGLPPGYLTQTFQPTMAQLEQTPGYQFTLGQGQLATESGNAPGVGALSGAALKGLTSFNQGLASTTYQQQYNNFINNQNSIFNRLSSIAGLGQNAASLTGNTGAQLATGAAQAQAAAAGSIGSGIIGATNSLGQTAQLSALLNNGGGGGGGLSDYFQTPQVPGSVPATGPVPGGYTPADYGA